jgi:hypothetical protein
MQKIQHELLHFLHRLNLTRALGGDDWLQGFDAGGHVGGIALGGSLGLLTVVLNGQLGVVKLFLNLKITVYLGLHRAVLRW